MIVSEILLNKYSISPVSSITLISLTDIFFISFNSFLIASSSILRSLSPHTSNFTYSSFVTICLFSFSYIFVLCNLKIYFTPIFSKNQIKSIPGYPRSKIIILLVKSIIFPASVTFFFARFFLLVHNRLL